jgi:hypothetical protein
MCINLGVSEVKALYVSILLLVLKVAMLIWHQLKAEWTLPVRLQNILQEKIFKEMD